MLSTLGSPWCLLITAYCSVAMVPVLATVSGFLSAWYKLHIKAVFAGADTQLFSVLKNYWQHLICGAHHYFQCWKTIDGFLSGRQEYELAVRNLLQCLSYSQQVAWRAQCMMSAYCKVTLKVVTIRERPDQHNSKVFGLGAERQDFVVIGNF